MDTYHITLDDSSAALYEKVAQTAGLPVEQVLSDALYRLAGTLSLEALARQCQKRQTR